MMATLAFNELIMNCLPLISQLYGESGLRFTCDFVNHDVTFHREITEQ